MQAFFPLQSRPLITPRRLFSETLGACRRCAVLAAVLVPCMLLGAAKEKEEDGDIVIMPKFEVDVSPYDVWRYATCDGFDVLGDVSPDRLKLFATEFATFLRFARSVCPELLLPEGTHLSVILASPARFDKLVPLFPSPLGYAERPWGVLARTQDTAVIAMCYEGSDHEDPSQPGVSDFMGLRRSGRDAAARDTLIHAQATYLCDPALVAYRKVTQTDAPPELPFVVAVGESRPFLAAHQPFLKTAVIAVISGMSSAIQTEFSYHDQPSRWSHYFPDDPRASSEVRRNKLPITSLPPLENLFAIDLDSPAWSSPLHRLQRDAFAHWALLANGPERARAFLDFLARSGNEPVTGEQFAAAFGGSFEEVGRKLMKYIDPKTSDLSSGLPSKNFWNRLPQDFGEIERTYEAREALPEESARIRADFLRLVGHTEAAQRVLSTRFRRKRLNDHIWITNGLMMLERRDAAGAMNSFEEAIKFGTSRPLPYLELARIKLLLAQAQRGGKKELAPEEAQPIFALLREACARPPVLRGTAVVLGEMVDRCSTLPGAEWLDALETTAKSWRYDTALLHHLATVLGRKGERSRAERLVALARTGTMDSAALHDLDELGADLAAPNGLSRTAAAATPAPAAAETPPVPENGEATFAIPSLDLTMVRIPAGSFRMGTPSADDPLFKADQQPVTRVTIAHGYWIGKTEVTQRQWTQVMGTTVLQQRDRECQCLPLNGTGDKFPMYHVSWAEAAEFCRRLTALEQKAGRLSDRLEYRLPTEAQWEYACRAGTEGSVFAIPAAVGWMPTNLPLRWVIPFNNVAFVPTVQPVATKRPNPWGLYDTYGNVSEWCLDWYSPRLPGGNAVDPSGPAQGFYRVVRGGSCWGVEAGIPIIGSAVRSKDIPTARFGRGFRIALVEKTGPR